MYCSDRQQASDSSAASNTFQIEFIVPGRNSTKVLHDQATRVYIERLFAVDLSFPLAQQTHGEWVSLRGRKEHTAKAKKYILSLCTPEVRVEACRPSQSNGGEVSRFARLLGESSRLRHELEREHQTVISINGIGAVLVQGIESDVFATVAKLNSLLDTMENGSLSARTRDHPTTIANSTSTLPPQPTSVIGRHVPDQMTGNFNDLFQTLPDSVKKGLYDAFATSVPPVDNVPRERHTYLSRGADPRREQRIKYFVGLGYSREKVETVLSALPEAKDDDILARLVRYPPNHDSKKNNISRSRPRSSLGEPLSSRATDYPPAKLIDPDQLRPIVIDGSNVAMRHGNGQVFSCKGIQLAVEYFRKRGHTKITVFVPEWRKEGSTPDTPITDQNILHSLEQEGYLKYTPSRRVQGRRIVCYDDRFIVKLATGEGGVIVSNDQYRDLVMEKSEWREVIETRLLQFTFANDYFMPPDDPLGRNGPSLDQLLCKDPLLCQDKGHRSRKLTTERTGSQQICPHLERCTFGRKCKFYHPERDQPESVGSTGSRTPVTSRSPTPSPSPDKRHTLHSGRCSREDLKSGYHGDDYQHDLRHSGEVVQPSTKPPEINIRDLHSHLSALSIQQQQGEDHVYTGYSQRDHPKPPQFINLQPPMKQHPQIRSTPTLPTPQDSLGLPPDNIVHNGERPHMRTFPMMNLSHGPPSFVGRPKGVTEDFTHQLQHSQQGSLPVTPSLPLRGHEHEQVYQNSYEHLQHPVQNRHLTGFPGPEGMPRPPRMRDTPPPMLYPVQGGALLPRGELNHCERDSVSQCYAPHRHLDGSLYNSPDRMYPQGGDVSLAPGRYDHPDVGHVRVYPEHAETYRQHRHLGYQEQHNAHTLPPSHSYTQTSTAHSTHHLLNQGAIQMHRGVQSTDMRQGYDVTYSNLYKQACAVLPRCEDRIRRVMTAYPQATTLEEVVDLARNME